MQENINGIRSGAHEVSSSSAQVARGNADLSQRTQVQASNLEQVASSMEEMTSTVGQNADNAQQAQQLAQAARDHADQGGAVVGRAVVAMGEINIASKKIAEIVHALSGNYLRGGGASVAVSIMINPVFSTARIYKGSPL